MKFTSRIQWLVLLEMLLTSICVSLPTESKISSLETELNSTRDIVHEMLGSVNKLSKQSLISKTEFENIKANLDLQTEKIEDISALMEDALRSVDKKIEDLQEDIVDKLEKKVKRQERGKFVSEETFDIVARQVEELSKLPESLNASVARTYTDITANINRMTITREEFAAFQLSVARDTCKTRVSQYV